MSKKPYLQIEDKHGAVASIYINPDNNHKVCYKDNMGHPFFNEKYENSLIEVVEQSVMDWATGKRNLADENIS